MESDISSEEILAALKKLIVEQVVTDRARSVERTHYGYPEHPAEDVSEFLSAFRQALTR